VDGRKGNIVSIVWIHYDRYIMITNGLAMKYFLTFLLCLNLIISFGQSDIRKVFNSKYCFESKEHSLTAIFKLKKDTVYLYYLDVSADVGYINGFSNDDDNVDDYAGKFFLKDFKNDEVVLPIRSYRNDDSCNLALSYNEKKGWLYWNLSMKPYPIGYLVRHATLKECK
jgi:hypothetical protein